LFRHFFVIASFRDRRIGYPDFVIQAIRHRVDRRASICFGGNSQTALKNNPMPLPSGSLAIDRECNGTVAGWSSLISLTALMQPLHYCTIVFAIPETGLRREPASSL
jgi:hypothetical protein